MRRIIGRVVKALQEKQRNLRTFEVKQQELQKALLATTKEEMMAKKRMKAAMQLIMQDSSECSLKVRELLDKYNTPPYILDSEVAEGNNIT